MAEIDTSIYNNVGKGPDPYAAVNNALGMANAFTQRQLLQNQLQGSNMDLAAKRGVANAFSGAVDANGNYDPSKFNSSAASSGAAVLGPAIISDSANAAHAVTGATTAATALSQGEQAWLASNVYPLFNDPKNPPKSSDVSGVISAGIQAGALDPKTGGALTLEMLKNSRTPQSLKQWAQNKFVGSMGVGQAEPGVTITKPSGPVQLSKGQTATATQDGTQPTQTGTNNPAPAPEPGITTGPPQGVQDTYKAANDAKIADYATSAATNGNLRNLQAASDNLSTLDPSDSGAIGDAKNKVLNLLVGLHIAPSTAPMNREEADKYLEKSKANIPAAQRSDMAQSLADISNPNLHTSLEATKALTRSAIAFSRMDAAMPYAWDAAHPNQIPGQTDPEYLKHRATFPGSQDPDAWAFDTLGPAEQRQLLAKKQQAGPAVAEKFLNSVDMYRKTAPLLSGGANP